MFVYVFIRGEFVETGWEGRGGVGMAEKNWKDAVKNSRNKVFSI